MHGETAFVPSLKPNIAEQLISCPNFMCQERQAPGVSRPSACHGAHRVRVRFPYREGNPRLPMRVKTSLSASPGRRKSLYVVLTRLPSALRKDKRPVFGRRGTPGACGLIGSTCCRASLAGRRRLFLMRSGRPYPNGLDRLRLEA
jgi:hypothetical protein